MAEYYKREIAKWIVATDDLNLEQEAAYSRVVDMIRLYERPFRNNLRVLSGMWRCNERKAKRLLQELIDAGKLTVEDGFIIDEKAVKEASNLRQLRVDAQSSGRRGGIESGKVRRKSLENNKPHEGYPSTREEKRREDNVVVVGAHAREAPSDPPPEGDAQVGLSNLPDDAVRLYEAVLAASGVRQEALPAYWMPPMAIIEVARWRGLGLADEEIVDVARSVRKGKKDPPNGPRALERFMNIAATVKVTRRTGQNAGGRNGTDADDGGSEGLRRSLARAATPGSGVDGW